MTDGGPTEEREWRKFAEHVAAISDVVPEQIATDTLLVADLDMDSVSLVELAVMLDEYFGVDVTAEIQPHQWGRLSAGRLFEAARAG
jgi:acyl carrier protein